VHLVTEVLWGVIDFLTFDRDHPWSITGRDRVRVAALLAIIAVPIVGLVEWRNR